MAGEDVGGVVDVLDGGGQVEGAAEATCADAGDDAVGSEGFGGAVGDGQGKDGRVAGRRVQGGAEPAGQGEVVAVDGGDADIGEEFQGGDRSRRRASRARRRGVP